jgi:hypothetical protein
MIKSGAQWFEDTTEIEKAKAKLEPLLPHILSYLKIPADRCPTIWLVNEGEQSHYHYKYREVVLCLRQHKSFDHVPFFRRRKNRLIGYRFDMDVYVLAHELAHTKQALERRIWKYMRGRRKAMIEGKFKSHQDKPEEVDANNWAIKTIKYLYREGHVQQRRTS